MSQLVVMGATMTCSFGAAPSSLVVMPTSAVLSGAPAANIMDGKPMVNVMPFGTCMSLANPMVAAATAAAMGALTPMPCVPVTAAPWVPGSPSVLVGNMLAVGSTCKLMCNWGGVIQVTAPGQVATMVP